MNSCVHAWCNIWGAHPAVSRAQSTDSLSLSLSIHLSVCPPDCSLHTVPHCCCCCCCRRLIQASGRHSFLCFLSKKWTDILLEQLLKGWIWLPVSCIAQSFPSARTDKEDKRKEYWKGRRTGSGGDIYMYVSIKKKTRKSHGEVKGVWKKTDYKKEGRERFKYEEMKRGRGRKLKIEWLHCSRMRVRVKARAGKHLSSASVAFWRGTKKEGTVEVRRRRRRGAEEEEARGSTHKMAAVSSASDTGKWLFNILPDTSQRARHHHLYFNSSILSQTSAGGGNCCSCQLLWLVAYMESQWASLINKLLTASHTLLHHLLLMEHASLWASSGYSNTSLMPLKKRRIKTQSASCFCSHDRVVCLPLFFWNLRTDKKMRDAGRSAKAGQRREWTRSQGKRWDIR